MVIEYLRLRFRQLHGRATLGVAFRWVWRSQASTTSGKTTKDNKKETTGGFRAWGLGFNVAALLILWASLMRFFFPYSSRD